MSRKDELNKMCEELGVDSPFKDMTEEEVERFYQDTLLKHMNVIGPVQIRLRYDNIEPYKREAASPCEIRKRQEWPNG